MKYHLETLAIHAGQDPEAMTGAVNVPIFQTSTYAQEALGQPRLGYEYSRTNNPTRQAYEQCLAALEGAKHGVAFASGMATTNNCMYLLQSGDEILVSDDVYGGTFRFFTKVMSKFGVKAHFVNTSDLGAVEKALNPKIKMVWIESPTNPLLKLTDIRAVARLAKANGSLVVVDNTFMSPAFQRPLELGADIVMHSATKYLGGHSDLVGGILATNSDEIAADMRFHQNAVGAIPGPFDCFLALRGLKTLAVRMQAHARNAQAIAEYLEAHPAVRQVIYPGLASHPQHALAKTEMSGFGGMISFEIKGGMDEAKTLVESTKLFLLAESLGGVESLIEVPATMTHASIPRERRLEMGIADGLIRLSVGIENTQDLIGDLEQALAKSVSAVGSR
ncbi:MAG: cystathionine gamma-synthase [Candidatus Eremiobacteraeota bacterium]|nr:cystathionine gamma-synthase [Candidatus Eremiobacteraeota bacterium]